jgi:hypothetical protein
MEIVNATRMLAGYTLGLDVDGRERVVVVVKGTFALPESGRAPVLADEQAPLVMADEFLGEPGSSAMRYESEYAPLKPRCDVLLQGSAYAPRGRATDRVNIRLRVGSMSKSLDVLGERHFDRVLGLSIASASEPFVRMPFHYGSAYGGSEAHPSKEGRSKSFGPNPVGVGYHPYSSAKALVGKPLANTARPGETPTSRKGSYAPMALGPIGRNFSARYPLAGTYDQNWLDNVAPFLPADFDPRYYQSAPVDQQIDHPKGGERVELVNLTADGLRSFELPKLELPIEITNADYERVQIEAKLDTLFFEPDLGRFSILWRASHPLRRNMLELRQCVIGKMSRGWYRARDLGKTYYPSLRELAVSRAGADD